MNTVTLFKIPLCNVTLEQAVDIALECLEGKAPSTIFFLNAHCVNIARENTVYRDALRNATYVFGDGIGVRLAAYWQRTPLVDNVNGTDLFPRLCEALQQTDKRIFLLGGEPGIAEEMKQQMEMQYPGLTFCGTQHGFFQPEETTQIRERIRESKTDLLLIALGVPRQELWIAEHLESCNVKAAMGVGGLFDFYSGKNRRAPVWMRRIGLEWLHRLYLEPHRLWKRYLIGNLQFILYTIKTRRNAK